MSRLGWILVGLVLLIGAASLSVYYRLYRVAPAPVFTAADDHFLYGSIGTEDEQGVPYWIWLVLPRLFPEYLPAPGGYAAIGIAAREGHEMPIGLSKVEIGTPRVGVNCAFCHTASVRATPGDAPRYYPGAPAHQTGPDEYRRFLVAAAADPRFAADTILTEISRNVQLPLLDRLLYRVILIPQTRRTLLRLADQRLPAGHPAPGRGRTDLVTHARLALLGQPGGGRVGTADAMPLWHLQARAGDGFFWDRSNPSLREVVQASAVFAGASTRWMDADTVRWDHGGAHPSSLQRVHDYLRDLAPPRYPFAVDPALAQSGAAVYAAACAGCHDPAGARAHTPIPIAELGTDRHRLDAWSADAAAALNRFGAGHAWTFASFRAPSAGYVAPPLDGVWLTAPYLHNGSVPTLRDLLEPAASRPTRFWRGYDVYDQAHVGFVSDGPEATRTGTPFDVTLPGNGNGGHAYGTALSDADKRALLEYLKTR